MKSHLALVALLIAAPAQAGALAKACMEKPTALPRATCLCLENEFNKRLTAEERRIESLALKGKFSAFNKKVNAMGSAKAQSFSARVAAAMAACQR